MALFLALVLALTSVSAYAGPPPGLRAMDEPPALCGYDPMKAELYRVELDQVIDVNDLIVLATRTTLADEDTLVAVTKRLRVRLIGIEPPSRDCKHVLSDAQCMEMRKLARNAEAFIVDWFKRYPTYALRAFGEDKKGRRLAYICGGRNCLNYHLLAEKLALDECAP